MSSPSWASPRSCRGRARIIRHARPTVAEIRRLQPAAVVTIDSSGFTWRVAQRLREAR